MRRICGLFGLLRNVFVLQFDMLLDSMFGPRPFSVCIPTYFVVIGVVLLVIVALS